MCNDKFKSAYRKWLLSFELFLNFLKPVIAGNFILIIIVSSSYAQDQKRDSLPHPQIDIFDVLRKWTNKPVKKTVDTPQLGVKNLSLLPVLGYSPANGFVAGGALSVTEFLGNPKTTALSAALINVSITTKQQVLLNLRYDVFTPDNQWHISGDNRFLFFTQPTYGLGIYGLNDESYTFSWNGISTTTHGSLEQPMSFNYLRIYDTFLKQVADHWYAGLGVAIDYNFKIRDESLKLDSPVHLTSNYIYSTEFGFNPQQYSANGLSFQILHDGRDNPVNAYKGSYFNLSFRVSPKLFGSTQNSTVLYYEYRTYINVNKAIPQNLIAFWVWGENVTSGHLPYLALPALTWDTYNRSGRGYIQGRFRGNNMLYGESEFRFRLTKNGLLGGVTYVNLTTASNPLPYSNQPMFYSVAPGVGAGLRIKMNKKDRTNIVIDYGRGYGFAGIYFNIRETF